MQQDNSIYEVPRLSLEHIDSPVETTRFLSDADRIVLDPTIAGCCNCSGTPASLETAGPRKQIVFNPASTRIAIVTCGGLCPGLNDVIRGIVMVSWYRYGVRNILGVRYGYKGLTAEGDSPMHLDPEVVEDIHQDGGTILGTSRGQRKPAEMVDWLVENGIDTAYETSSVCDTATKG
jgi:6-phosphofructokinase 1